MVKSARPKRITSEQRSRVAARRRVIFFPDAEMNAEFERVAFEEGFVHRRIGQDPSVANPSAFAVWLFKQFLKERGKKAA